MKRVVTVIILICILASCFPLSVFASSGTVGQCKWELNGTILTISGKGSMGTIIQNAPWGNKITELIIEEGVTEIGTSAFADCTLLQSVKLPSTLKTINHSAFYNCTSLKSIDLPDGVVTIGGSVFYGCESLVEIKISRTVTSIGYENFTDCYALTAINVDEGNPNFKSIEGVLYNKNLTKLIKYPQNKPDQKLVVPETVSVIGYKAFDSAWKLIYITLPQNLTSIETNAFIYTNFLYYSENFYQGGVYIDNYLIDTVDDNQKVFSVKEGTKLIAGGAFTALSNLQSIYIPEGVTGIGENAFSWCSNLGVVYLPKSLKKIEGSAFYDCNSLKKVYYRGTKTDKAKMSVSTGNSSLTGADWTYESCINAINHSWGEKVEIPASCTADGSVERTCKKCGNVESQVLKMTDHKYTITSITKEATCTVAGVKTVYCESCNASYENVIPPKEHVFGAWAVESEPTCLGVGVKKHMCSICQAVEAENIEPLGHDYGEYEVVKEATSKNPGLKTRSCEVCYYVQNEEIPVGQRADSVGATPLALTTVLVIVANVLAVAVVIIIVLVRKKRGK